MTSSEERETLPSWFPTIEPWLLPVEIYNLQQTMETAQSSDLRETPPSIPTPSEPKRVKVSKNYVTSLYDGSERDGKDAIVDIIFVHGLGGGPETTWSTSKPTSKPSDPPVGQQALSSSSKRRYLDRFYSKPHKEQSAVNAEGASLHQKHNTFWPAEFLPVTFPQARILTWGYESKVSNFFAGAVDKGTYYSHAENLLNDVKDIRVNVNPKRPIIWIAHSLGGIILKEALLVANSGAGDNSSHSLKAIYQSTKKILFLGTPHRGSSMVSWGIIAERVVRAAGFDTNDAVLKQLKMDSPELGSLNKRFINLWRSRDFDIVSFKESTGMEGMHGLNGKVVEEFSSSISDETQRHLPGNHRTMCKFSSPHDDGYRRIEAELRAIILQIQDMAGRANPDFVPSPESLVTRQLQHLDLFDSLMPDTTLFRDPFLLYNAITKGDVLTTRKLLATGAKIDEEAGLFKSDLSLAVSSGKIEVVELLLDHGANIEKRHSYSMETPLIEATKSRSYSIVELLLQRGANSQLTDWSGKSSLHVACEYGDEGLVELLLRDVSGIEQRCSNSMDTPLLLATRSGKCAVIRLLIRQGALIEATDLNGKTPLHLVSELWGDDTIVKLLLRAGADPNAKESRRQRTPLHYAAKKGNLAVVKDLLQSKAYADTQDNEDGTTALHIAAELGHADIVSLLISKGASIGICLRVSRKTPLHLASSNGHDIVVKILMEAGANVEATQYPSVEGKTPLHVAAQNGHHQVVRLLGFRAIIDKKEIGSGNTPLLLAALGGHTLAAKTLLEQNAEIDATNNEGSTALYLALKGGIEDLAIMLLNEGASTQWPAKSISPLQCAAYVGQISVVRKLLEQGVDIQDTGEHGESALICAASVGHLAIVSLLLLNKAELNSQNAKTGYTALHQASRNGHGDIVRLLLTKGADFNHCDNIGNTPLHDAALYGHEDIVVLLINKGASCTATNTKFVTPLHLAAMSGHHNIMLLLIKAGAVVDDLDSQGLTPLVYACMKGHESTVRALLIEGAQVAGSPLMAAAAGNQLGIIDILEKHRDANGAVGEIHALCAAAYHGHALAIKKLLRWERLSINAVGPEGVSALHIASTNGQDSAIQVLLDEGADVDHRSGMDWLPIHGAALNGHSSAIRMLLDAGSSVECLQNLFTEDLSDLRRSDKDGLIRLFVQYARATKRFFSTISDGNLEGVSKQATNTAIVRMRDGNGHTALHMAVEYNCTEAIPILCDIGVAVDTKNYRGRTALHGAIVKGNIEAQRLLLRYRPDINSKDLLGFTALHIAVTDEKKDSVKILMEAGADISIKENITQMNPYQYAETRGFMAALPLLEKYLEEKANKGLEVEVVAVT